MDKLKRTKIASQSLLKVGDKFSLFSESKSPDFEIIAEQSPGVFTVKRMRSGMTDENQQIPHPSGDFPCWVWR